MLTFFHIFRDFLRVDIFLHPQYYMCSRISMSYLAAVKITLAPHATLCATGLTFPGRASSAHFQAPRGIERKRGRRGERGGVSVGRDSADTRMSSSGSPVQITWKLALNSNFVPLECVLWRRGRRSPSKSRVILVSLPRHFLVS